MREAEDQRDPVELPYSRPTTNKERWAAFPLMRCMFKRKHRRKVRTSVFGSRRKGRKAKHLSRVSTLRGKRLKAEVLTYLSSFTQESKDLIREVNGGGLLKHKTLGQGEPERNGVAVEMRVPVRQSSDPEVLPPAQMPENARSRRKRVPKSCDCCGPNSKPHQARGHAEKPTGHGQAAKKRGRKKKEELVHQVAAPEELRDGVPLVGIVTVPEVDPVTAAEMEQATALERVRGTAPEAEPAAAENVAQTPPLAGDAAALPNGTAPRTDCDPTVPGEGMEVEHSAPYTNHSAHPLWDHRYCKRQPWGTGTAVTQAELPPKTQLPTTDINNEGVIDLIHEFLEHFYEKYGSFIPLSEADVLEYLNKKVDSDASDRKLINTEVTKYKAGLASAPMHFFKVTYNKHTLTLEDLSTLDDQNWVNDQVINMYGELIMEASNHKVHFFNSFFHRQLVAKGYEGVKRWTKKVDLFSKRLLLIPLHLEIHWSLITVDIGNQNINFYDSQGIMFKYAVDNILRYILAEAKEKKQAVFQKGWKMIVNKCIPQQKNDSDCGVFVLEYCKCLALKKPLQFTQEDMPKVRKRIYKELCEYKLVD